MNSNELFKALIFLLKLSGIKFEYSNDWKDKLLQLIAIFTIFAVAFINFTHISYIIFDAKSVDDFAESVSFIATASVATINLLIVYKWRLKFKNLMEFMTKILQSGNSISQITFNRIKWLQDLLCYMFLFSTLGTVLMYVLKALYATLFENTRTLPFTAK